MLNTHEINTIKRLAVLVYEAMKKVKLDKDCPLCLSCLNVSASFRNTDWKVDQICEICTWFDKM